MEGMTRRGLFRRLVGVAGAAAVGPALAGTGMRSRDESRLQSEALDNQRATLAYQRQMARLNLQQAELLKRQLEAMREEGG